MGDLLEEAKLSSGLLIGLCVQASVTISNPDDRQYRLTERYWLMEPSQEGFHALYSAPGTIFELGL